MIQTLVEYLKGNYFMIFYVAVLFLSIKKYRFYFNTILKFLPIIISYTLLSELLGLFISDFDSFQIISEKEFSNANNLIFNIYDLIYFNYFYFIYYRTYRKNRHKKIILIGVICYLLASLLNTFFEDFFIFPQTFAYCIGSLLLLICIGLYFKEIKMNLQNSNELLIWLSIGHFIFYCSFPVIMFLGQYNYELYKELNLKQLHYLLISAMYACFVIGFIKLRQPILRN